VLGGFDESLHEVVLGVGVLDQRYVVVVEHLVVLVVPFVLLFATLHGLLDVGSHLVSAEWAGHDVLEDF
jgi:hypothetical protein